MKDQYRMVDIDPAQDPMVRKHPTIQKKNRGGKVAGMQLWKIGQASCIPHVEGKLRGGNLGNLVGNIASRILKYGYPTYGINPAKNRSTVRKYHCRKEYCGKEIAEVHKSEKVIPHPTSHNLQDQQSRMILQNIDGTEGILRKRYCGNMVAESQNPTSRILHPTI